MPRVHLLLRLLLALVLVLDGIGAAAAATQLRLQHAGAALTTAAQDASPEAHHADRAPCHEPGNGVAADPAPTPDDRAGQAPTECCASPQCHCPCAQHAPVAVMLVFVHDAVGIRGVPVHTIGGGHPPPALPHLIRPPIG